MIPEHYLPLSHLIKNEKIINRYIDLFYFNSVIKVSHDDGEDKFYTKPV